ncbi:MAG: MurR/RpiR family transcriptional regulator [Clostridia bacterium]|nr:MurR/RpiR family transcriptional regulator [Clostridia bacterium]
MKKDLAALIASEMPNLSKGKKRIAETILTDYDKVAYMTAAKLSEMVGVSESTVVRFAIDLGFDGYPEFQHAVQELVRAKLTPNQRIRIAEERLGGANPIENVMTSDAEKIKYTMHSIDRAAFAAAVDAIVSAENVYIFGVRSSAFLAGFFNFNLGMIQDNVRLVQPTSSSEVFEQILGIGKRDVLIAISFPRYSGKIVNALKYARSQDAMVIALTDSVQSPLAEHANCLLTAQSDMASFVDSLVAPLSIIDALLVAVTQRRGDEVRERFDRLERVWDEYDVYAKY